MSEDKLLEARLKEFYDRVPDVEDALPFKVYLLKHEDSRMAWYLLGRQYAVKGEDAKANYCFSQAGEIYEAFESKPAPVPQQTPDVPRDRRPRRGLKLLGAVLLLAAGLAIPAYQAWAPGGGSPAASPERPQSSPLPSGKIGGTAGTPSPTSGRSAQSPGMIPHPGLIAAAAAPDVGGRAALGELLTQPVGGGPLLLVKAVQLGPWSDWLSSNNPAASVTIGNTSMTAVVTWYDRAWCHCTPGSPGTLRQTIADWKPVQEQKIVLVSAIARYREKYGKLPLKPEDLAGNYPSNHMAGWSPSMTGWFRQLTAPVEVGNNGQILMPGWPTEGDVGQPGAAVPSGAWHDMTKEPIRIVVDKTNHRLAVISGNVLLRNYAVGLGGKRTPEGKFVITEKVRNPNGRTDGVYGNRGMTLSDTRYGIHGTNQPASIGKDESLGCIRMLKADVEELYDLVPMGTTVTIQQGGLPADTRTPPNRFRLPTTRDETNPRKVYNWLT